MPDRKPADQYGDKKREHQGSLNPHERLLKKSAIKKKTHPKHQSKKI
jgi:hypothetical protein